MTSWSSMGFSHLPDTVYENEIRILPKEWSKQILKLIKEIKL